MDTPEVMPQEGGSYTRNPDGSLVKTVEPPAPAPEPTHPANSQE